MKENPLLTDIPATMLWTLHNRAYEAAHPNGCIIDKKCLGIYQALDYDYSYYFGEPDGSHGVRSMLFDQQLNHFLQDYPNAVIINLGEGLETQRYRIHAPEALWVSIDLPEAIAIRERFIEPDQSHIHIAKSALDQSWLQEIPENRPIFITAQGLFMYFKSEEMAELIAALAKRFPKGRLMFDYLSPEFSARTTRKKGWWKTKHHRLPLMPWGIKRDEIAKVFSRWVGEDIQVTHITYLFPRGLKRFLVPLAEKIPFLRNKMPGICLLDFPPK